MRATEAYMKAYLDGWFFTLDHERGRVLSNSVPLDYIPDHRPKFLYDAEVENPNAYPWSESEDLRILELRRQGMTFREIAKVFNMANSSIVKRFRQIEPPKKPKEVRESKYSFDLEARIVGMRLRGMPYPEIGKLVNLTPTTVRDIFRRYRKRGELRKRAA